LTVWYSPTGYTCAICGKKKMHGIGIEGKKVDIDVCDDCAGGAVVATVDAKQKAGHWKTKRISKRVKVTAYERGGKR